MHTIFWFILFWIYGAIKDNFLYVLIGVTFLFLLIGLIQIYIKLEDIEDKVDRLR